jgi:hypothetical protein
MQIIVAFRGKPSPGEEISSRSEFAKRETAAGRTAYLEHHGVAAGGCRRRTDGRVWAGLRSKIETRRSLGCLRPYLEPEATDADGPDSEPNTSRARLVCGSGVLAVGSRIWLFGSSR